MKSIHVQRALAFIFLGLGAWCLLQPSVVEGLGIKPEFYVGNRTTSLFIACFGAQAMLVGTVILSSRFLARTFLVFGLVGSVPFFFFNYYFYFIEQMFTDWMLLDFIGNIGIFVLSWMGYRLKSREDMTALANAGGAA